jgi:hypothetical protein
MNKHVADGKIPLPSSTEYPTPILEIVLKELARKERQREKRTKEECAHLCFHPLLQYYLGRPQELLPIAWRPEYLRKMTSVRTS